MCFPGKEETPAINNPKENRQRGVVFTDTQTSMLLGKPKSAMCVQNFDDSRDIAIRITYRISLRTSSLWEPRHPSLKVVMIV